MTAPEATPSVSPARRRGEAPDAVVGGDAEAQVGEAERLRAVFVGHA